MSDAASCFPLAMLADDVTGGCDAGVQFSLRGAATRVYLELPSEPVAFAGVSVIVNHSRGETPEEASRKVAAGMRLDRSIGRETVLTRKLTRP